MTKTPLAVVISDVHYSLNTLKEADYAFRHSIDTAHRLGVPLFDCGDLTNDKAILRGEVVNALIDTMKYAQSKGVKVYCLVGNHSLLNERRPEHALHFLSPYVANVVGHPTGQDLYNAAFIPYCQSTNQFLDCLTSLTKGTIVFAHQGTKEGLLGDYVKDERAFDHKLAADYKVYLGHYHAHYELGTTVSIGNPYTLTFGEVNDGPKGYLIVYKDGSFERVLLPELRRHVILETSTKEILDLDTRSIRPIDLVWLKVKGPQSELAKLKKNEIGEKLFGHNNFKLDKVPTDSTPLEVKADSLTGEQLFDALIDSQSDSAEHKANLKSLWREIV